MHRRSLAERRQILNSFKESGLSLSKFSEQAAINRATLYRWIREDRETFEVRQDEASDNLSGYRQSSQY